MLFTGEYEHTIDAKQRLAVPAPIRSRMERDKMTAAFFLVPMPHKQSIWLWPEDTFERLAGALEQSLLPGEEELDFDAITFPFTRHQAVDSAGRVRIPDELLEMVELGNSVMIAGMRDHLELHNLDVYLDARKDKVARYGETMSRLHEAYRKRSRSSGGD